MTSLAPGKIVDEIDLTLLVGCLLALSVFSSTQNQKLKGAIAGRRPGREQHGVGKRFGPAEIVELELCGNPVIAVIRAHLVAEFRHDRFSSTKGERMHG